MVDQARSISVRVLLTGIPDVEIVPTVGELREAMRLRAGKLQSRGTRLAWDGFRIYMRSCNVDLPGLPGDPSPTWRVPPNVAKATRRLLGSRKPAYLGIHQILRVDVSRGALPCGYDQGVFTTTRLLNRAEQSWVAEILAWNPTGSSEDPLFPVEPGSKRSTRAACVWNRVRFEET
jgi:hypothetical protein